MSVLYDRIDCPPHYRTEWEKMFHFEYHQRFKFYYGRRLCDRTYSGWYCLARTPIFHRAPWVFILTSFINIIRTIGIINGINPRHFHFFACVFGRSSVFLSSSHRLSNVKHPHTLSVLVIACLVVVAVSAAIRFIRVHAAS